MDSELRNKIGRLFVVGFHSTVIDDDIREMIEKYRVGSIILFSRNIESPKQLAKLTRELQEFAKNVGYEYPLLITLDQENGVIRRIDSGVSLLPGAMSLGATDEPINARSVYEMSGQELRLLGINWDLAPDADVNNNPKNPVIGTRSFGEDPKRVGEFVVQAVDGLQTSGIAATLKHFPGHGNTSVDSHLDLPTINLTLAELENVELIPFKAGITHDVATIMIAHVLFPALEKELPASLSKAVMVDLLRDQLNYDGVIVTDDLEMEAIASTVGTDNAALIAFQNGADLIMVSHRIDRQRASIEKIYSSIESGQIAQQQVDQANERILHVMKKYATKNHDFDSQKFQQLVKRHQENADKIYLQTTTAVRTSETIPWKSSASVTVINFKDSVLSKVADVALPTDELERLVRMHTDNVNVLSLSLNADKETVNDQLAGIPHADKIIIGTININSLEDNQRRVVNQLVAQNYDVAVISLRNPYDINWLSQNITYIAAYEYTSQPVKNAINYLFGKQKLVGKLPVTLNGQ